MLSDKRKREILETCGDLAAHYFDDEILLGHEATHHLIREVERHCRLAVRETLEKLKKSFEKQAADVRGCHPEVNVHRDTLDGAADQVDELIAALPAEEE